jgi:hypothetical protein
MDDKNIQLELEEQAPVLAGIYSELNAVSINPDYFAGMQQQVLKSMGVESTLDLETTDIAKDLQQKVLDIERQNTSGSQKEKVRILPIKIMQYAAVLLILIISGFFIRNQIHQNTADVTSDEYLISYIEHYATEEELMWLMDEDSEMDFLASFSDEFLIKEYLRYGDVDLDFLYLLDEYHY